MRLKISAMQIMGNSFQQPIMSFDKLVMTFRIDIFDGLNIHLVTFFRYHKLKIQMIVLRNTFVHRWHLVYI